MEYQKELFQKKANMTAMLAWIILNLLLSLYYIFATVQKLYGAGYLAVLLLLCWVPFGIGFAFLKKHAYTMPIYKHFVGCAAGNMAVALISCIIRYGQGAAGGADIRHYIFELICLLLCYIG